MRATLAPLLASSLNNVQCIISINLIQKVFEKNLNIYKRDDGTNVRVLFDVLNVLECALAEIIL